MNYGDRLRILRNGKGISQKVLTDRLQINRSTYARYETSTTQPDYDTLNKLAAYFDVTTDYILGSNKAIENMTNDDADEELKDLLSENDSLVQGRAWR